MVQDQLFFNLKVLHEFTIRFMRGTQVNTFIDQIGLCACTGVDIDYGGDKFSTHSVVIWYQ